MNERIQELAEQVYGSAHYDDFRFAESLIKDVLTRAEEERADLEQAAQTTYQPVDYYTQIRAKIDGMNDIARAIRTLYTEE